MGASLREIFTPLVAFVLLSTRARSRPDRSFPDLRREIERLLEDQKALVKRHDIPPADYENACFAVVAWIDERILRTAHDTNKELCEQWKRSPLQIERFQTANAGEEFFTRMERLGPSQKEVVEIYHLCLSLGFRGRYYDETEEYKRVELRRGLVHRLPVPFLDLYEIEKKREPVTPAPYAARAPGLAPRRHPRSMLVPAAALGALAVAGGALIIFFPRPVPPPPPPPTPTTRPREAILADVEETLKRFECSGVTVASYRDGLLGLEGRVESESQRDAQEQAVKEIPEVTEVRNKAAVVPRPFCEVLELLAPFHQPSDKTALDLRARTQREKKGCDAVYVDGEKLVVDVIAEKPLNHVYVDYYVADRENVAHLFPNPKEADNFVPGESEIVLGGPFRPAQWQIQAPFGPELLTVVVSPKPLFPEPRLEPERVGAYLTSLRAALSEEAGGPDVVADTCFITTKKSAGP